MTEEACMLELTGIEKTFFPGTVNEKAALRGVSLQLAKGDRHRLERVG